LKPRQLLGYLSVSAIAYMMNLGVVLLSIKVLEMDGDFAQLVGVPIFTLISFMLNQ
jgi:putative flippase GtrA